MVTFGHQREREAQLSFVKTLHWGLARPIPNVQRVLG